MRQTKTGKFDTEVKEKGNSKKRRLTVCLMVTAESTATNFYNGYVAFLHAKGWDVWLVASSQGRLEQFSESQHANAISVPMRRDPSPMRDLVSLANVVRALVKIRPNVIVTATPKASLLGCVAAFICRVPVRVYQLWGLRLETEIGPRREVLRALEWLTARAATQVVANSSSLARRARELGVTGGKVVRVLGPGSSHGVDVGRFSVDAVLDPVDSATLEFLSQGVGLPTLGFVGRVHDDKGIDTLIDALRLCAASGLSMNVLVVGPNESDRATHDLQKLEPSIRLRIVGRVADARPYYRVLDFLCLPSRREGFPNVVLEAAAMGIPTITSDATGAIDSVVDGRTGIIFRTDDTGDLASAIRKLAEDKPYREQLGLNALSHVWTHFRAQEIWRLQEENLRRELLNTE